MAKAKLTELDLVRGLAILAVLIIHVTALATVKLPFGSVSQTAYLLLNKFSNFAVPVFIFLSGVVLFYRYKGDFSAKRAAEFYGKRIRYIVVPYVLWSCFYYVYNQWFSVGIHGIRFQAGDFYSRLLWGETSYHLYYVVIIVQLYILFPLLMALCERFVWFARALPWIGVLVQAAFYVSHMNVAGHRAAIFLTYFGLFTIGGGIGLYYDRVIPRLRAWRPLLALAAAALGFALFAMYRWKMYQTLSNDWFELVFNLYGVAAALAMIGLFRAAADRGSWLAKPLSALGAASFAVYLMHPAILSYAEVRIGYPGQPLLYHIAHALVWLAMLFAPWAAFIILKRLTRYYWIVFGK